MNHPESPIVHHEDCHCDVTQITIEIDHDDGSVHLFAPVKYLLEYKTSTLYWLRRAILEIEISDKREIDVSDDDIAMLHIH
jgi:hypothetical protein